MGSGVASTTAHRILEQQKKKEVTEAEPSAAHTARSTVRAFHHLNYFAAFFVAAQRFRCAAAIRSRASALILYFRRPFFLVDDCMVSLTLRVPVLSAEASRLRTC